MNDKITVIKIKNLNFKYSEKIVLKNINLEIKKGEFVGIIGPNGSGKTTLLKNICNILKPEDGFVCIDGKLNYKQKELAKKLAVVSESEAINFNFNAADVVLMGRNPFIKRFRGETNKDRKIAASSMKATDTIEFTNRSITELSSGERQRVFIAQCLAQTPKIILLDEPTNYLDINHKIKIFKLLSLLNKEKKVSILTVLHDLSLAGMYCKKLILMSSGKIFAEGETNDVLTEKNIKKVFGVDVSIKQDSETGKPIIIYR